MTTIVESTEKDVKIFKKLKELPDEDKFYNNAYFVNVGLPDVSVGEEDVTLDGEMKGGRYKVNDITYPFRYFVEFFQNKTFLSLYPTSRTDEQETEKDDNPAIVEQNKTPEPEPESEPTTEKEPVKEFEQPKPEEKNMIQRFSSYGDEVSKMFTSESPEDKPAANEETDISTEDNAVTEEPDNKEEEQEKEESSPTTSKYWVVKMPIINEVVPYGTYEKAEAKMSQILRDEKVDRMLNKKKVGEMREVGSRYIRLCEGIEEWSRYELDVVNLPGSRMAKYSKIR